MQTAVGAAVDGEVRSDARPRVRPALRWGRGGAVVVVAGMLAGGSPATAAPDRWTGFGGAIAPPVAQRAAAAATDRLAPAAGAFADAAWSESLALATAALDAAAAADGLAATLPPDRVPVELGTAADRLTGMLGAGAGRLREAGDLTLSAAVARTAGEVFRYSMEVESLAQIAAQEAVVVRVQRLADLEVSAGVAAQAATALAELEPLTPLPDVAAAGSLAAGSGGMPGSAGPTSLAARSTGTAGAARARLRPDTPRGVAELVRRWANGMIPADALCPVPFDPSARLQCDAAAALTLLNDAHRAEFGRDLDIVSAYRPLDVQVSLRATKGWLAAVPGTSNHGWGLAVDFGGTGRLGQFDHPGYRWLQEHAEAFGWHHPRVMEPGGGGPQEPWHWEYGTA